MTRLVFDNSEDNRLYATLKKLSGRCNQINIAVAFFSELELVKKWIKQGIKVNVVLASQPPTFHNIFILGFTAK